MRRNPTTGQPLEIPPKTVAKMWVAKVTKEAIVHPRNKEARGVALLLLAQRSDLGRILDGIAVQNEGRQPDRGILKETTSFLVLEFCPDSAPGRPPE